MLVPEDSSGLDTLGVLRKYSHHVAGTLNSNANTSDFSRIAMYLIFRTIFIAQSLLWQLNFKIH